MATITSVLADFNTLSLSDREYIKSVLISRTTTSDIETYLTNERFADGKVCPICGCIHILRNGHTKSGSQRYICKDCGKSFVITTNSIVSGTRMALSVWEKYIDCMINGFSVRKSAAICDIHRNTSFAWRHKILDALQDMANSVRLNGIVEADETFFRLSFKGNHKKSTTFTMPRASHKRGKAISTRGLSKEQVCVPCAVNRNGLSIAKISNLGRVSTKNLHSVFDDRIDNTSTIVTDKMNSYVRFAKSNGIDLIQLKTGKSKKGIYHIQYINSYHSKLKGFMNRFKGVSTKYLNNYLIWHNFVSYAKETDIEKHNILMRFVFTRQSNIKCRDISKRNPVPVLA